MSSNTSVNLYEFKLVDLTPLTAKLRAGETFYLRDEYFFTYKKADMGICDKDDRGLNVQNTKIDYTDVKNVYFLRGTFFDRQFFRRTYPNINVRKDPKYADIILYDDKSLTKNSKHTIHHYLFDDRSYKSIPSGETLKVYKIPQQNESIYGNYFLNVFADFLHRAIKNTLHNAVAHNKPWWASTLYTNTDNQALFKKHGIRHDIKYQFDDDPNNTYILRYIFSKCNSGGSLELLNSIYEKPINDYYEHLNSLGKPFIKTSDFFKNQESLTDLNELSLDSCISIWNQLNSTNEKVFMTAAEALVSYNSKKYIPLQSLLLKLSNINFSYFIKSKKIKLFLESYVEWFIDPRVHSMNARGIFDINNYTFINHCGGISGWESVFDKYYDENKDVYDVDLLKDMLYKTSLLTDYLKITSNIKNKATNIQNFIIFKNIVVKNIEWSFNSKNLQYEDNYAISATSKSIDDEFGV